MKHQVEWIAGATFKRRPALRGARTAKAAIIGGGIAGLTVAQELLARGIDNVVLLEAAYCGAGATGRSSGFITPASELQLDDLVTRFGESDAQLLWDAAQKGCDSIRATIDEFRIKCDVLDADSFWVASNERSSSAIRDEHDARLKLGYESRLYEFPKSALRGEGYGAAVRWGSSFAMDGFAYAQELARKLERGGLKIFEGTRAKSVRRGEITTARGSVKADMIFACADSGTAEIRIARSSIYHALTFLILSERLSRKTIRSIFRDGPLLVWDTDLIYQYLRPTRSNRVLVGGGLLRKTYASHAGRATDARKHLVTYVRDRFPQLADVKFEKWWEGFIGVTKDFLPLAGRVGDVHIAACAAGLPWSVIAAKHAVQTALGEDAPLERFFSPRRTFTGLDRLQPLLRRRVTFALSHGYLKSPLAGKK